MPVSKLTPVEYAQKRADETGNKYAVFRSKGENPVTYAALHNGFNRKAYASIGAEVVAIFSPKNKP